MPNYVVIEQRTMDLLSVAANDDHPSHDIAEGQKFIKEVYEALRASPQWNEILFVIIYDEHGGFYDHVPTPVDGVPNPDDIVGPEPFKFKFDRLGVRVPAIIISPWIEPGKGKNNMYACIYTYIITSYMHGISYCMHIHVRLELYIVISYW